MRTQLDYCGLAHLIDLQLEGDKMLQEAQRRDANLQVEDELNRCVEKKKLYRTNFALVWNGYEINVLEETKNNIQGFIDHMYININPYP